MVGSMSDEDYLGELLYTTTTTTTADVLAGGTEVKSSAGPRAVVTPDIDLHLFVLDLCIPEMACKGKNMCHRGYEGHKCLKCTFKYFRRKSDLSCVACGWEQVMGTLAMSAIMTFFTVGILVGMICYLKFQSDLKFATVLKIVIKMRVFKPLKEEAKKRKAQFQRSCGTLLPASYFEKKPKVLYFRFHVEDFGGNRKWDIPINKKIDLKFCCIE